MAKAEKTPEFTPEIALLYCRQALADEVKPFEGPRAGAGFVARLAPLPCSSKVEVEHIFKIMESGVDGILVVACPDGACQFLVGNTRAEGRINYAGRLLEDASLGTGRLVIERGSKLSLDDLMALGGKLAESLRALGPRPANGDNA